LAALLLPVGLVAGGGGRGVKSPAGIVCF
jgi:hypothetical protein